MTQGEALTILKTGANIFLTGEPGSGKTHTINAYIDWLRASGVEPSVTAATGIAATHVGGVTLHSWSGIGISESLSRADVDRIAGKEHIAKRLAKAKVLIIEEISMLSAATFEMADAICREVRRDEAPFGGLTVVLVGDFFQLPPISRGREAQFAFESPRWRDLNLITCYLTEQYRQDDPDFLDFHKLLSFYTKITRQR
jgi:ATP-dependent exoDNAse (exonuclease V) alpha subunit